jgi:hypothetical protein
MWTYEMISSDVDTNLLRRQKSSQIGGGGSCRLGGQNEKIAAFSEFVNNVTSARCLEDRHVVSMSSAELARFEQMLPR